jgi:hypothetical protein
MIPCDTWTNSARFYRANTVIHFRSDIDAGLALSKQMAGLIIEQAKSDGSQ